MRAGYNNGFIVCWEVYDDEAKKEGSTYSGESFVGDKKLVFPLTDQSKALKTFIEYGKKAGLISDDSEESED